MALPRYALPIHAHGSMPGALTALLNSEAAEQQPAVGAAAVARYDLSLDKLTCNGHKGGGAERGQESSNMSQKQQQHSQSPDSYWTCRPLAFSD